MHLKKIELQGFKSFANKTILDFPEGITTIVGPNGSGKSNISDAVRWVLGEQSAKNLRGAKMEDVIFAGTESRKMVGFAEVTLTIDNTLGLLPIDYSEVTISRRVYRSGDSEYLINENACRLKDIQELFMDTGIGKDGYSIISQGKIDEILSSKSEERRAIFEEAAGVVKYKTRKNEAEKKLANTDLNLERIIDILSELTNILKPLEDKAKVARRYLELKERLKYLDVSIFLDEVNKNSEKLDKFKEMLDGLDESIKLEEQNLVEIDNKKIKYRENVGELILVIEQKKAEFYQITNEISLINSRQENDKEKLETNNQEIVSSKEEIKEDNEKITVLLDEIKVRKEKKKMQAENKIRFEKELEEKQQELSKITSSMDEKQKEIEKVKILIDKLNEQNYEGKSNIRALEVEKENEEKSILNIDNNKVKEISELDKQSLQLEENQSILNNQINELQIEEEKLLKYTKQKEEKLKELDVVKLEKDKLWHEVEALKNRYNNLVIMEKENDGFAKSIKEIITYSKENNMFGVELYGTLSSVITTKEEYEIAIESAMGGYLQNVVVDKESTAKNCIEYLKKNLLGRVTFLPLSSVKRFDKDDEKKYKNITGYIGMATNLVEYDKKYESVINLALGRTVVMDNLENSIQAAKKIGYGVKIVTLEGEILSQVGSITGGTKSTKATGVIGRSKKIENMALDIEKLKETLNKKEEELKQTQEISSVNDNKIYEINENIMKLKLEKASQIEKISYIKINIEKIKDTKEKSVEERKNIITRIDEITNEINKILKDIDSNIIKISNNQNIVDEYTKFNKEKSQRIDFLNEDIVNLKISVSSFEESASSIDEMIEKVSNDIDNFKQSIDKKAEYIVKLQTENSNIITSNSNINNEIAQKKNEIIEINKAIEDTINKKSNLQLELDNLDTEYINSVKNGDRIKEEKNKIEGQKIKYDTLMENIKTRMWDEYELTISSANVLFEENKEQIEKIINSKININKEAESIKNEIRDLGPVSVESITEYANTKERVEFMKTQKLDLEDTKQKLVSLIANMTSIMKKQFITEFKTINENFNEVFKSLFGGGKASLSLEDESNVLESGIEIEVQPPGKKLQSMLLLSGGERALTAIALLFAILKIKAPPFCILDEIEAALDDVNVSRFADYIKKYSDKTQFIIITHRKGTMEAAQSVYGVTMEEYGISKVISMNIK